MNTFIAILILLGFVVAGVLLLVLGIFCIAFPLKLVWNWLMPKLFNLPKLTTPEMVGVLFLSSALFPRKQ